MATYYCSHNAAGGGVGSVADPFTLQELIDTCAAGDTGIIMNTGKYTIGARIDFDTRLGTGTAPINLYAGDSSGNIYYGAGASTITTTTNSLGSLFYFAQDVVGYLRFHDLILDGGGNGKATNCILTEDADSVFNVVWNNCRITNASGTGAAVRQRAGVGSAWIWQGCTFDNNGKGGSGSGLTGNATANRAYHILKNCAFYKNETAGAILGIDSIVCHGTIQGCRFYRNGIGLGLHGIGTWAIEDNVFFANTGNAIDFSGNNPLITSLYNNIMRSNGGYGIDTNGQDIDQLVDVRNNCSHNNTSGHIDINGGVLPGLNNITSDPKFTSETDGSEDFTLQSDSPCKNAGYGYNG